MISTYLNPLNFLIFMLGLSIWFDVVVYSFPIAFLPILLQDSYSSVEIGTVMSILWWASLSTTFILIVVSHLYPMEKSKQKIYRQVKIIIACNIVQSCLHIWVAFNPTYVTFLLYRMFAGICSGFAWIYILAVAIDIEADEKYKNTAMTFLLGMSGIGEISGPPMGAFLYSYTGLFTSYIIMTIIAVSLSVVLSALLYLSLTQYYENII